MTDPYAQIASFYDAEFDTSIADVAGYARRGVGGPLLVLGCGTGRVTRGLEGLRPVTGLDRSEDMLDRARKRSSATYVRGELRDFSVGSFAEIVAPNGCFNFLHTRADQFSCLRACRRALRTGAPLTLDLPIPDFQLLHVAHTPETHAWTGRVDDREVTRTREVTRRPVAQRIDLLDRFYVDGSLHVTSLLALRIVFPAEVEWMLECADFAVDSIWGDHLDQPLREDSDRLLVRALAV